MFFTFQRIISSLSLAFWEFIGDAFALHTHTHTHARKPHFFHLEFVMALDFVYQQIFTVFSSRIR